MPKSQTILAKALNYGLGESTLWLVFIFEKLLESLNINSDDAIEHRLVIDGYQIDSPKFDQESHPTITLQQISKKDFTQPRIGGRTSTSITRTRKLRFGLNITGDQGRISETFFYHYYNGSPQFLEWNQEFVEKYNVCTPEWGGEEDIDINNSDDYAVGQNWIISFLHTLDYSSSPDNIEKITIPENAIVAEKS